MAIRLHYSRGRLGRLVLLGLAMIGLFLWVALDPSVTADSNGIAGRITAALGPETVRLIAAAAALAMAALALAYLRMFASGDSLAMSADRDTMIVRNIFTTRAYVWRDIDVLFVRRMRTLAGEQILVMVRPRSGRETGVAANALRETEDEIEAWVEAAEDLRRGATGRA